MKLRGLTKLALSGVALAAVAATLGTSTYAWYVTNSTASANGVTGRAKAGGLGNVLVAQNATGTGATNGHTKFAQNMNFNTSNFTATTISGEGDSQVDQGLLPTTPVTAANAKTTDQITAAADLSVTAATTITAGTVWVDAKGQTMSTNRYITFDLWVLSSDATELTMTYTISNTTAANAVTQQIAYAPNGLPSAVSQGENFAVNFIEALRMSMSVATGDSAKLGASTSTVTSGIFDVKASASESSATIYEDFVAGAGANANSYYTDVLGDNLIITTGPSITLTGTSQTLTVGQNEETKYTFYIWLEGTDAQCFDSCAGQSFGIDFQFSAA